MIELPEALVLSEQLNNEIGGKIIVNAVAGRHPHKFAWFSGAPEDYCEKLTGRKIINIYPKSSRIFIELDDGMALVFGEGTRIRRLAPGVKRPIKHQLLIDFMDDSSIIVTIQMYGFILLENIKSITNKYVVSSMENPSPYSEDFNKEYFDKLLDECKGSNLSTKAFLATEQRIPGLGNGVLQDILFNARLHPRLKLKDFNDEDADNLYNSIKITLDEMGDKGGRDTEKDLYGSPGAYKSIMSKYTVGTPCPSCGELIEKQSYMGGSIYVCPSCQRKE